MKKIPQHEFEAWGKCKRYPLRTSIADLYLKLHDRIGKWDDNDDRAQAVLELFLEEFSDFIVEGEGDEVRRLREAQQHMGRACAALNEASRHQDARYASLELQFKGLHADHVSTLEECKTLRAECDALQVKLAATEAMLDSYKKSVLREAQNCANWSDREDAVRAKYASDPVRAAAVAFVETCGGVWQRSADSIRADSKTSVSPVYAAYHAALADLLDAVAMERGAERSDAESFADFSRKSIDAICSEESPAPNWRALVETLRDACDRCRARGSLDFADERNWLDENAEAARTVSALIAALDKPEGAPLNVTMLWGYPLRSWTQMQRAARSAWDVEDPAKIADRILNYREGYAATLRETATLRKERDELSAALEATRKELAEARNEKAGMHGERAALVEILGVDEFIDEPIGNAARRVVAERDALKRNGEHMANIVIESMRRIGWSDFNSHAADAMVLIGREIDTLKSQLADVESIITYKQCRSDAPICMAVRGLVAERDELRAKLAAAHTSADETWNREHVARLDAMLECDRLKAKLAAQDELRDAAVEYVETLRRMGLLRHDSGGPVDSACSRYQAAARDAAAKNGV